MGRIRHKHFGSFRISPGIMVGADDQNTGQFSVSSCGWLKGDSIEPTDLAQPLLGFVHQSQGPLHGLNRLKWVDLAETRQAGNRFVDLGVIFHGAGSQGIEPGIHCMVQLGDIHKVAHDFIFRYLDQGQFFSQEFLRQIGQGYIRLRIANASSSWFG